MAGLRAQLAAFGRDVGMPELVEPFLELLDRRPRALERDEWHDGHLTGSAWLVSADNRRTLLTHHRKLGIWVQPGGHADGDADLGRVSLREATEESGLDGLALQPDIFDVDRHAITERDTTPGHVHYDVRFVVRATVDEAYVVGDESLDLAWRSIADLPDDPMIDASVQRMARRWLARVSGPVRPGR